MRAEHRRRRSRRASPRDRRPMASPRSEAVVADRQDVAVGGLEGQLREPGGGEVGPDGRGGVGRAPVPGPDDLAARRQNPRSAWMVRVMSARLMFPNTPHTSTRSAGTCSPYQRTARRRPRRSDPVGHAGRRRPVTGEGDQPGSSSTSSAETSARRGWVATTSITSRPCPAHRLTIRIGPGWSPGQPVEEVPDHRLHQPPAAATASSPGPRRTRASAPSANRPTRARSGWSPRRHDGPS